MNIIATGPKGVDSTEYFQPEIIGGLIKFIADWGSLGAKPQMGLGVVRITSPNSMNVEPLLNFLKDNVKTDKVPDPTLPSLQDMFFFRVYINSNSIDRIFDMKHILREEFRYDDESADERDLRHFVMGYARGDNRIGSKVTMSFPYDNIIRIWGWMPEATNFGSSRENVMNKIYHYLESEYGKKNILYPNKFNPARYAIGLKFLEDLVKEQQ
jgi:CRISPR-associated protein Cmr1